MRWSRTVTVLAACATACLLWVVDGTPSAHGVEHAVLVAATVVWCGLAASLLAAGRFPDAARWRWPYTALALLLPAACWFALATAYRHGPVFLISILAIVWAADIAAYFAGRAFGKRKLAPSISPGKTWAGAVGGALAAIAIACVVAQVPSLSESFFSILDRRWPPVAMPAAVFALVVLSVVGDLFESQLKRQRGVKDSGKLLPGHGGVYDRVDALIPVVPVALLITLLAGLPA